MPFTTCGQDDSEEISFYQKVSDECEAINRGSVFADFRLNSRHCFYVVYIDTDVCIYVL